MKAALAALAGVGMLVSACATPGATDRYATDLEKMTAECRDRGGILTPRAAATDVRPQTDYACQVTGEPSSRFRD